MVAPTVVLFDFFGTLVTYEADRTALRYTSTHALLSGWGSDLDHDAFVVEWDAASIALEESSSDSHVEHSMVDAAIAFGERVGLSLDDVRCAELIEVFLDEWAAPVRIVPSTPQMLCRLADRYRLGLVSNTNDAAMVPALLATHDIGDVFETVLLSVDHGHRKPHPSIYQAALDHFGCAASDVVFVGDSYEADYLGPTTAGMTAYLIDPAGARSVPPGRRLSSVLDLETALATRSR